MKRQSPLEKKIIFATVVLFIVTVIFAILNYRFKSTVFLSLAITFGTIFYHFIMRLLVGLFFEKCVKRTWNYNSKWFSEKKFEKVFYEKIKIKKWKSKMPTYYPADFSLKKHTADEIIQCTCGSEAVHEAIVLLSFVPLFFAIPFGEFFVFLITSLVAAEFDMIFVMMQRYNRPRLIKLKTKLK